MSVSSLVAFHVQVENEKVPGMTSTLTRIQEVRYIQADTAVKHESSWAKEALSLNIKCIRILATFLSVEWLIIYYTWQLMTYIDHLGTAY